MSSMK